MRVLWLIKGLGRGGAEQLLVNIAGHLDPDRFAIDAAYVLPWKNALVEALHERGVRSHCLDGGHPLDPRWIGRLRRLVRERGYDVVHAHLPYAAIGARLGLRKGRPPLLYTEHNVWERYRTPMRWANALTYHRNTAVIAVSPAVRSSIGSRMARFTQGPPIETLVHGVDPATVRRGDAARAEGRKRLALGTDELVVGTVGNFTAKKDQANLLAAFATLPDALAARLVLIGSGPLEPDLRALVGRLDLEGRVVFTGSRDDVSALLPAFDVFALSSRHEGLPIAMLEAMAAGIPVVATAVGGIPEALPDGTGILVPPADRHALAAALHAALADPVLRTSLAAGAAARADQFTILPAVHRIEALYAKVAGC